MKDEFRPHALVTTVNETFDLVAYARKHRCRLRNLHDGYPVPPAIVPKGAERKSIGYVGDEDRWNAIVGHRGYIAVEGHKLTVYLFFKSALGVNRAIDGLNVMGASIDDVGDAELGATAPVEAIDRILRLIRVSKLRSGNISRLSSHTDAA